MNSDDALRLTQALERLAESVREGSGAITEALQEMDLSIARLTQHEDGEKAPTAGQVFEKIAEYGAKAVHKAITDWEKRLEGSI